MAHVSQGVKTRAETSTRYLEGKAQLPKSLCEQISELDQEKEWSQHAKSSLHLEALQLKFGQRLQNQNSSNRNHSKDVSISSFLADAVDPKRPEEKEAKNAEQVSESMVRPYLLQQASGSNQYGSYRIWVT